MENPEEILHSLEEFSKLKPKDIPRELEDYLCFVAKTGDPVYQWSAVKSLFREKLINVITEFYESCPTVEIPPCPNVEMFNYDSMKNFILEKLDTFAAAPFTVQRICELLTTPRKEYNRIDKYMRALEKNILVVSTTEPANRRNTENGEGIVNGIETEHLTEANSSNDINVEEMDDSPSWPRINQPEPSVYGHTENSTTLDVQPTLSQTTQDSQENSSSSEPRLTCVEPSTSNADTVITLIPTEKPFVSIEPVITESHTEVSQEETSVTTTATPAPVQKRRDSIEPLTSDDNAVSETVHNNQTTEESVQIETTEDKRVSNDAEIKTEFESSQSSSSVESDNGSSDGDIDGTAIDEKSVENEKAIDESDGIKDEEVKEVVPEEKEPEPEPVPQKEPDAQQTCDNTHEVKKAETCIEDPNKQLTESISEQTLKESEPHLESVESSPNVPEETLVSSGDDSNESTKEPSQDESNPPVVANEPDSEKEKQQEETPMEVDSDENLVKESSTEVSSIEANTTK